MEQTQSKTKSAIPEHELWDNLKISNSFIFAKVMRNPELCKGMLESLLDITIDHIEYPTDSKNMRLEVYLENGKGTIYNVVLQVANSGTSAQLSQKAGYFQKAIDLEAIAQGIYYDELPDSFVIFICTFDVFEQGLWKYTFKSGCKETNTFLDDGTTMVFFNASGIKGTISKNTENILKFIKDNIAEDDFTKKLAQEIQKIKEDKECRAEYMTLFDIETSKL